MFCQTKYSSISTIVMELSSLKLECKDNLCFSNFIGSSYEEVSTICFRKDLYLIHILIVKYFIFSHLSSTSYQPHFYNDCKNIVANTESCIQAEEPTVLNYSRTIYNTFERCVLDTCKTFLANTPSNVHPFIKKVCSFGVIFAFFI